MLQRYRGYLTWALGIALLASLVGTYYFWTSSNDSYAGIVKDLETSLFSVQGALRLAAQNTAGQYDVYLEQMVATMIALFRVVAGPEGVEQVRGLDVLEATLVDAGVPLAQRQDLAESIRQDLRALQLSIPQSRLRRLVSLKLCEILSGLGEDDPR